VIISRSVMNELRIAAIILGVIILGVSISTASAQDIAAGEISFSRCLGCHAIGVNAKNKIGPQLNGIDGRKCGTAEGYTYSAANKECAFTWNEAVFVAYIRDPKAKIPGTKKSIFGIRDETEARNLWAYLRQFGPDGRPK
jgi:cytochrome c